MAKRQRKKPRYQREAELKERIPANLDAQAANNSYSPRLFYEDIRFQCCDCGTEEIWTGKDQQWWYEVAKGSIYSTAVRCKECRKRLQANHQGTPRKSQRERRDDFDC